MITLSPLWDTMKKKNVSQYALLNKYGISRGMLHNLKNDKNITLETLNKLCNILDCDITDIIKYTKDESIQFIEESDNY